MRSSACPLLRVHCTRSGRAAFSLNIVLNQVCNVCNAKTVAFVVDAAAATASLGGGVCVEYCFASLWIGRVLLSTSFIGKINEIITFDSLYAMDADSGGGHTLLYLLLAWPACFVVVAVVLAFLVSPHFLFGMICACQVICRTILMLVNIITKIKWLIKWMIKHFHFVWHPIRRACRCWCGCGSRRRRCRRIQFLERSLSRSAPLVSMLFSRNEYLSCAVLWCENWCKCADFKGNENVCASDSICSALKFIDCEKQNKQQRQPTAPANTRHQRLPNIIISPTQPAHTKDKKKI